MPHLECLFHCGRQKRDNISAMKMLHQMFVRVVVAVVVVVVVVAPGLVTSVTP